MPFTPILTFLLMSFLSFPQSGPPDNQDDPYSTNLVGSELRLNSSGARLINSHTQKRLAQLGDRAAISILKILTVNDLRDEGQVRGCLFVIESAFSYPSTISVKADNDPKVTLFLLTYFESGTPDAGLLSEIRSAREFVLNRTTKSE